MGVRQRLVWRRSATTVCVAVIAVLAAACGPPPPTPGPNWVTTQVPRTVTSSVTTNYLGSWTDANWFATLEVESGVTSPTAELLFYPRSGPGNSVLSTPQSVIPTVDPNFGGPVGESVVGLVGSSAMEFFKNTGGTWSTAGTFPYPTNQRYLAMNDDWLILGTLPADPGLASQVFAYPLDSSGSSVTVGAPQAIAADPAWPTGLQNGFGIEAAIDGDLLAIRAQDQFGSTPPAVRVFRAPSGVFTAQISLGGVAGGPELFGQSLDVDDGVAVDRVAVQAKDAGIPGRVDIYADSGTGFALEQTVQPNPADPDVSNGLVFGSEVALDGSLLAVNDRQIDVPSSEPGHADLAVTYVQLYRRGATWATEAEVPMFTNPGPPDIEGSGPVNLQASGNHVAAAVIITTDPPPGCSFFCFNIGFEAWSIDRTN